MPFHQLAILPTCHFTNLPFYQLGEKHILPKLTNLTLMVTQTCSCTFTKANSSAFHSAPHPKEDNFFGLENWHWTKWQVDRGIWHHF
jgi:hypothetical protein